MEFTEQMDQTFTEKMDPDCELTFDRLLPDNDIYLNMQIDQLEAPFKQKIISCQVEEIPESTKTRGMWKLERAGTGRRDLQLCK